MHIQRLERVTIIEAKLSDCTPITPAWIIYAWAPVLWQASSADQRRFVHLGTRVLTIGDEKTPCTGQTLWGEASENHPTGIAWDWVEIQDGVVAMSDPFGLITNLRLLDTHGVLFDDGQITVQLHQLVHTLPWQIEVQRALRKPFGTPPYPQNGESDEPATNKTAFRSETHLLRRMPSPSGLNMRRSDAVRPSVLPASATLVQ